MADSGSFTETSITQAPTTGPSTSTSGQITNAVWHSSEFYDDAVARWTNITREPGKSVTDPDNSTQGAVALATSASRQRPPVTAERVVGMRKWAGAITDISDGILTVELAPLDHEGPTLVADFELALLAPDDSYAQVGDVVYLTTRMVRGRWGHLEATSHLRLRRAGQWSAEELRKVLSQAAERSKAFERYENGPTRGRLS